MKTQEKSKEELLSELNELRQENANIKAKYEQDRIERKNVEQALQDSERRLSSIYNTVGDVIYHLAVEDGGYYRFISVNQSFLKVTGLKEEMIIGKMVNEVIPEPSLTMVIEKYQEAIEKNCVIRWEETSDYPTGQLIGEVSIAPVFDNEGRCSHLVGSVHDITDRKRAEEELHKLNAELEDRVIKRTSQFEAANKELEAFSYSVSHDLRAPLRAINGYAKMLEEDYLEKLDDEGKRLLGIVQQNAKKMGNLIDDLLAFSRLGKKEISKSEINMDKLVRDIFQELKKTYNYQTSFQFKNLNKINGDYALINQVIVNLLSNALKFSAQNDKPIIEIDSYIENDKVIFSFKDNGVGFDMKYYDKLFGVFQRLHSMIDFEGTGVGLAIVKKIINKHGGEVWAEGKINEGATFYFSLPIN